MELDLAGKIAFVRGIDGVWGGAVANRLAACGAHVEGNGQMADLRLDRGQLDILVNAHESLVNPETAAPLSAVQDTMDACEEAAEAMGQGRIVNLGSIFGLVPARGAGDAAGASAALFARTRALALALAPRRILVNAVAILHGVHRHTPLGRAAEPKEVANAVLFLLAAESSYLVGEILRVDGGWSSGYAREF